MKKALTLISVLAALLTAGLRAGEIHDAAAAGDLNKVRTLIQTDSTLLESKDNDGNTPLITACKTLQLEITAPAKKKRYDP